MSVATFDVDGYPTEQMLETISEWPYSDFIGLIQFISESFNKQGRIWQEHNDTEDFDELHMATGGWSGNESIISAMKGNMMIWTTRWISSSRGGKFVLELKSGEKYE